MTTEGNRSAEGISELFDGPDGLAVSEETERAPLWSSSVWTLALLIVIVSLAATAWILFVTPVAADALLGWLPSLFSLLS